MKYSEEATVPNHSARTVPLRPFPLRRLRVARGGKAKVAPNVRLERVWSWEIAKVAQTWGDEDPVSDPSEDGDASTKGSIRLAAW